MDWSQFINTISWSGIFAIVVTIILHYVDKPEQVAQWVEKDPEYRTILSRKLRSAGIGSYYKEALSKGLDWLDRNWGTPNSARAFGVCVIIALCYGYAVFFIAWGIFGSGHIGGTRLADGSIEGGVKLLGEMAQPWRGLLALWLITVPALGFVFGRFLGRQEHRIKIRLRWRYRWRRRHFELGYRAVLVVLVGSLLAMLGAIITDKGVATYTITSITTGNIILITTDNIPFVSFVYAVFGAFLAVGPKAGVAVARQCRREFLAGPLAAVAGAVAVAVSGAVALAFAVAGVGIVADVLPFAVAGAGAIAVAFTVAVGFAVAAAVPSALPVFLVAAGVGVGFGAGAIAGAVAAGIGTATAGRRHRGAYAGGIGTLVALGIVVGWSQLENELTVLVLIFFLVLPLANGLWDWLSWWVSRKLGRHLLRSLEPALGLRNRALVVLGHGLLDLTLAVLLLATMAFLLTFGFEIYNQVAEAQGVRAFELHPFLENAADQPWTDGLWLTVMLISTLFPTALHVVVLLASPIALVALPTEKRLTLADDLDSYDQQPDRHASIQRRTGKYVARERHGAIAIAAGLFVILVGGLVTLINLGLNMLEEGQSVAHLVLWIAEWGITAAEELGRLFLTS